MNIKSKLGAASIPCILGLLVSQLSLLALPVVFGGSSPQKTRGSQPQAAPARSATCPQTPASTRVPSYLGTATPNIVVQNGRVRVDTAGGPVFIRQTAPCNPGGGEPPYPACLTCHCDIEDATLNMGGFNLDCTFCHGGDPDATTKAAAHVQSNGMVTYDKTVPPIDDDLDYQRFVNPSNLRVQGAACALCHPDVADVIHKGMMATAAGHYAGGLYQNGTVNTQTPIYGTFAVTDNDGVVPTAEGAVASLLDLVIYDPLSDPSLVSSHFAAVPSQACARCHLWSRGKGYRGAIGAEGVYRADGCAACHMLYADDGLSQSADQMIDHQEPGHPMHHVVTKAIPTDQCLHCHHRGARIGLSFTGRSQMPPRLPSGPGVPGTTDVLFNGNYHYTVADTNPQDAHGEAGLHCIDCHVAAEIMGDGNLWGHMDQATKIECETCHGRPSTAPTLIDNDGNPLPNVVFTPGGDAVLTSKVDGVQHTIPVISTFLDPSSPSFNITAACAMNDNHIKTEGGLECYACHSSWVPNCFGCHFERDEQQMGLNLMTRQLEIGKVTTNNKIFETMRHFSIGPNSEGRVSPYLVACQPIADVTAPDGSKILEYAMPVTSNGLSGLAHNPVNPHTVRGPGEVRTCAECHRSPPTLGFGSGNYSIARDRVFAAGSAGVRLYDRGSNPNQPPPSGDLLFTGGAEAVVSLPNVIEGVADVLYVARGTDGVSIFDQPDVGVAPTTTIAGVDAIDISRVARYLYVVDSGVGIRIYDNDVPTTATLVATVPIPTALRAVPWGIHLFVPAGNAGLVIVNIADHATPYVEHTVTGMNAADVELYSHFQGGPAFAVRAYVADPGFGVRFVDLLPAYDRAQTVGGLALVGARGLDAYTSWVAATATEPSREHDYLYVAAGAAGLHVLDITDPDAIVAVSSVTDLGGLAADVSVSSQLAPPGVDDYATIANETLGLQLVEITDPLAPINLGTVAGSAPSTRVLVEVQQMDRYLDEQGNQLKESSHPFTSVFTREDIVRILSTSIYCNITTDMTPAGPLKGVQGGVDITIR